MAFGNPSPLEVEFQTQSYFKIWSSVLKLRSLVGLEVIFFNQNIVFRNGHNIRKYIKIQGILNGTLSLIYV